MLLENCNWELGVTPTAVANPVGGWKKETRYFRK
jgi:hypothetical protein